MKLKKIDSNERSSRAVVAGNLIFIGGTTAPMDVEGITDQTRFVLAKLERELEMCGGCKANLVSATIYLRSMNDYVGMNTVWNDWLKDVVPPSRACVSPVLAGDHALVEISVVGATND